MSVLIAHYFPLTLGSVLDSVKESHLIKNDFKNLKDLITNDKFIKQIADDKLDDYIMNETLDLIPNLSYLYEIGMTIPLNSVACERCFSCMGNIKTKIRNRLSNETLDGLLRIALKDIQELESLDLKSIYEIWSSKRKRIGLLTKEK